MVKFLLHFLMRMCLASHRWGILSIFMTLMIYFRVWTNLRLSLFIIDLSLYSVVSKHLCTIDSFTISYCCPCTPTTFLYCCVHSIYLLFLNIMLQFKSLSGGLSSSSLFLRNYIRTKGNFAKRVDIILIDKGIFRSLPPTTLTPPQQQCAAQGLQYSKELRASHSLSYPIDLGPKIQSQVVFCPTSLFSYLHQASHFSEDTNCKVLLWLLVSERTSNDGPQGSLCGQ